MPGVRLRFTALLLPIMLAAVPVHAACDGAGADAAALAAARAAVDAACPCMTAASHGAYTRCASDVIQRRVAGGDLTGACRRDALRYARLSVCGRPGAVVCCRVRNDGRTNHRVAADPASCVGTPRMTACVSGWQSVATGCDATGCVPVPVCGNGIVESGEDCDPPDLVTCDASCHTFSCDVTPSGCGDGVIEPGEACEPPGVAGCARDCQLAPCAPPAADELGVACVDGATTVGIGATPGGYLMAWSGPQQRALSDILVRRFDADVNALDAALTVASAGAPCTAVHTGPAVTSDDTDHYVVWSSVASVPDVPGAIIEAIYGRRIESGGPDALDQLALNTPIGMCRTSIGGPTMAAGVSTLRFAIGWFLEAGCFQGPIFENPVGTIRDLNPSPVQTPVALGFPIAPPPNDYSASAASVASLGGDTLWVWHAIEAPSTMPPFVPFVAAVWTDIGASTAPFVLTARGAAIGGRPAVAAGAASFLVAWRQGATDTSTTQTEIRAVRATRAAGSLDPDGGLLLATASGAITAGPVVAFDGGRWLVVWAESSGSSNDLRAVAVRDDGTVVDSSPRLVAANVAPVDPGAASVEDGRVVVLYARRDGTSSAVRAKIVTP